MRAALFRLADLPDFDASRVPDALFRRLGLDRPQTLEERIQRGGMERKHSAWDRIRSFFNAEFSSLEQEKESQAYLDYIN